LTKKEEKNFLGKKVPSINISRIGLEKIMEKGMRES
jgi:hypothetical protein